MDSPQRERANILSDVPVSAMFYYIQHSDMGAPKYEHADVPSTCVPDCFLHMSQ
jgi:hypothetical protein